MAKQVDSIEIFARENGTGWSTNKPEATKKGGAMNGAAYFEGPKSKEDKVLPHVGKALNIPLNAGNNKANAGFIVPPIGTTTKRIRRDH